MVLLLTGFFQSLVPWASPTKLATVLGALSGKSSHVSLPAVVLKTAVGWADFVAVVFFAAGLVCAGFVCARTEHALKMTIRIAFRISTSGAKARILYGVAARLKPCPDTNQFG